MDVGLVVDVELVVDVGHDEVGLVELIVDVGFLVVEVDDMPLVLAVELVDFVEVLLVEVVLVVVL